MTEVWLTPSWLENTKGSHVWDRPAGISHHHIYVCLLLRNTFHCLFGFKIPRICFNQISPKQLLSGRLSSRPRCLLHLPPLGLLGRHTGLWLPGRLGNPEIQTQESHILCHQGTATQPQHLKGHWKFECFQKQLQVATNTFIPRKVEYFQSREVNGSFS